MNILILTGKFGMGHYSASTSIQQQIQLNHPNMGITIKDFFDYSIPLYANAMYNGFTFLVNRGRNMYNYIYRKTEDGHTDIRPIFLSYFLSKLNQLLIETKPDLIFSTLPFCSQLVSRYKQKYGLSTPLITCITDITGHSEWINENTNYYLVGSNSIKSTLIRKGVSEKKILINGIPVKEEFKTKLLNEKDVTKKILIMGGGLGLLPKDLDFYQSLNQLKNVKTTVITGNNHQLHDLLYNKFENIQVIGYTNEVYKYMHESDVIISKPGGITLFESIFSETPLLVFQPFLQQEINNTTFILNNQIGKVINASSDQWVKQIESILYDNETLSRLKYNVRKVKNNLDTSCIDKILLTYAPQREIFAS
ncbi:glycosyltransferase [Paludicola sp. MB14-C6]|uniref:MGDG synthase family glycosyltransferase n=1 Tax=Paludihabitans sp. MB14-C6 TaxID=3070656 RepID=UPI0027DDF8DE|nr:glycosyltransferase [Paludicola sp. MB14-C6]WMJ22846.1 glycosyltransferase [Paludicola sp. MB14-C6]